MDQDYDAAMQVQRAHEDRLLALPGVTGVAVKLRGEHLALVVDVDPDVDVPGELPSGVIDGLPVVVERNRYRLL